MLPSERLEKSVTKDNLWIYILALLRKREMYPYEIRKEIKKNFGFSPGNVTAYIVLKRLQAGGYVRVFRKSRDKGPEKTYYGITSKGESELSAAKRIFKSIKL
jgi:PadR family transcriptional regulator PadR